MKPWKLQARQSSKDHLWYVRLSGGNGEIILRSKGYQRLDLAETLCTMLQSSTISILPLDGQDYGWYVRPHESSNDGLYYNRLTTPLGDLMWSEGYARVDSAMRTCQKMRDAMVVTLEPLPAKK